MQTRGTTPDASLYPPRTALTQAPCPPLLHGHRTPKLAPSCCQQSPQRESRAPGPSPFTLHACVPGAGQHHLPRRPARCTIRTQCFEQGGVYCPQTGAPPPRGPASQTQRSTETDTPSKTNNNTGRDSHTKQTHADAHTSPQIPTDTHLGGKHTVTFHTRAEGTLAAATTLLRPAG